MFKIHEYLIEHSTINNTVLVSVYKRGAIKQIKRFCVNDYNNNRTFLYKRTIKQTLNLNKNVYNEEYIW